MTSAKAREIVVENGFQCFCGAPIATTEETETCLSCSDTRGYDANILLVRRIEKKRQRPDGANRIARNLDRGALSGPLTSIESDFEDHPGDGPHGRFILFASADDRTDHSFLAFMCGCLGTCFPRSPCWRHSNRRVKYYGEKNRGSTATQVA